MGDANLSNPSISCRRWTRATRCLTRIAQRRWPVWPADQSRSNYQYYCIDSNQILRNTEDHKVFIVGGPNTCPKIQDDGRPPFWKKTLNRHIYATVFEWFWWNLARWRILVPYYRGQTIKISNFWKFKMAAAAILKITTIAISQQRFGWPKSTVAKYCQRISTDEGHQLILHQASNFVEH